MRVLRGWRKGAAPIGFVPAAHRDRDAMLFGSAGLALGFTLTAWALCGQAFCFNAKNGVLHIGLVKVARRAKARRRRPRRRR